MNRHLFKNIPHDNGISIMIPPNMPESFYQESVRRVKRAVILRDRPEYEKIERARRSPSCSSSLKYSVPPESIIEPSLDMVRFAVSNGFIQTYIVWENFHKKILHEKKPLFPADEHGRTLAFYIFMQTNFSSTEDLQRYFLMERYFRSWVLDKETHKANDYSIPILKEPDDPKSCYRGRSDERNELLEHLINNGLCAADAVDRYGNSLLAFSLLSGSLADAQYLISKGANVHNANQLGKTLFHQCFRSYRIRAVSFLTKRNANPYARDILGRVPLHYFDDDCQENGGVRYLNKHGFDFDVKDSLGHTPLYYATKNRQKRTQRLFIECGAKFCG